MKALFPLTMACVTLLSGVANAQSCYSSCDERFDEATYTNACKAGCDFSQNGFQPLNFGEVGGAAFVGQGIQGNPCGADEECANPVGAILFNEWQNATIKYKGGKNPCELDAKNRECPNPVGSIESIIIQPCLKGDCAGIAGGYDLRGLRPYLENSNANIYFNFDNME